MLRLRDKLAIGPTRVVSKTVLPTLPKRERHRHVPALFDDETGGLETGLTREAGQHVRLVDAGELADLLLAERLTDDHSRVHPETTFQPALGARIPLEAVWRQVDPSTCRTAPVSKAASRPTPFLRDKAALR